MTDAQWNAAIRQVGDVRRLIENWLDAAEAIDKDKQARETHTKTAQMMGWIR